MDQETQQLEKMEQKSIEQYFEEHAVSNPDLKAKILPEITNVIYERNMLIVKFNEEKDDYKKKQIFTDVEELEEKLNETFEDFEK